MLLWLQNWHAGGALSSSRRHGCLRCGEERVILLHGISVTHLKTRGGVALFSLNICLLMLLFVERERDNRRGAAFAYQHAARIISGENKEGGVSE